LNKAGTVRTMGFAFGGVLDGLVVWRASLF